ncbi:LPXTG cell wall anchor domain-containing protein, partial [Acinetobacter baumannii]|uniref:LPXTG cell wall anchor domain-containing protein n=1 Tax=Acinetobacter baumannii TaxID=470 RepID=UPI001AECC2A1
ISPPIIIDLRKDKSEELKIDSQLKKKNQEEFPKTNEKINSLINIYIGNILIVSVLIVYYRRKREE